MHPGAVVHALGRQRHSAEHTIRIAAAADIDDYHGGSHAAPRFFAGLAFAGVLFVRCSVSRL